MLAGTQLRPRPGSQIAAIAAGLLGLLIVCLTLPDSSSAAAASGLPTSVELERATERLERNLGTPRTLANGGLGEDGGDEETDPGGDPSGPILDGQVMVALYGAPQLSQTIVGQRTTNGIVRKLKKQVKPYAKKTDLEVTPSINLIGVIATADAGADGLYRTRQSDQVIAAYLRAVRKVGGRLTLDIQPGRSPIKRELRALRGWIAQPDIDIGIDPEWNVGRKGVPGVTEGKVSHRELNAASRYIQKVIDTEGIGPKAMIVHQFREGSVKGRRKVQQGESVEVALNFDGIGSPRAKKAGYANLAHRKLFDGFSLFYSRDTRLLKPGRVLALDPDAEYVMYQ